KSFPFVNASSNSGVENKQYTDEEYYAWLRGYDAIIAAGSEDPAYGLTTPKYFEIPASGALLFAQRTDDLDVLGFRHGENCIAFTRDDFEEQARAYLEDPDRFLHIRAAGRDLMRERHALSVRLDFLEEHISRHLHHD
ncbi:MAG TPA: glycosyltransferase, partial [Syntrophobacteraceae bacterium]|nr:glycosyltransferase [Syntrophobacteraceae bacterium]